MGKVGTSLFWRNKTNWKGEWMIGKEETPVNGKDKDFLGLEE